MTQQELLVHVVRELKSLGIPYMITGSVASSFYGEPRATHDVDIIVTLAGDDGEKLVSRFPASEYYLSKEGIDDAIRNRTMFNLLHTKSGEKIDFWLLTDDDYDLARFARKIDRELFETTVTLSAPEDVILSKLNWDKLSGGSDKQNRDARRVYELQYEVLDQSYLESWIDYLSIGDEWQRLIAESKVVRDENGSKTAPE